MIYVGFVIPIEEALRLLKLDENIVKTFYDTEPIYKYLKDKGSKLVFDYMDKGACLFGVQVKQTEEMSVEDMIVAMIAAKKEFLWQIKQLKIDISKVNLNRVAEESWLVENPEPYVISL